MGFEPPAFIAFTGVDRAELQPALAALSARYPVEWGILLDDARAGDPLFPDAATRAALLQGPPLRWAVHVCGAAARAIAAGTPPAGLPLAGFSRLQINHGFSGSDARQTAAVRDFGRRQGARVVLQCPGDFPGDSGVDWLFDVSFGRGTRPTEFPPLRVDGPFCGFSGGINESNVRETLQRIAAPRGVAYWVDMESGVRTGGWFDVARCEAVCRAVYG